MIDGQSQATLLDQYESVALVSDGIDWYTSRPTDRPIGALILTNDGVQNLVIAPVVCSLDAGLGGCGGSVWVKLDSGQGMAPAIATPADWPAAGSELINGTGLEIDVTNADGTEQIFLQSLGVVPLPSAATTRIPLDPDNPIAPPVGSDLSYDTGRGQIVTSAGGLFIVNVSLVDYTAP